MRILIAGAGSIGRRHLKNIRSLGFENVDVVSRKPAAELGIEAGRQFSSLSDALSAQRYDAAVLCTPTAFHMEGMNALLNARIERIYLEKPVSHSLEGISELLERAASYPTRIVVGYDLHFDPGLGHVRELLKSGAIGKPLTANAVVGQYLPDWRPHEDYRKGMSARIATGGGVMLDLVHEFDYLHWLFGRFSRVACFLRNTGSLEIETEDVSDTLLEFASGITGTVHLDYLQPKLVRHCLITGSKGIIRWDLAASAVTTTTAAGAETFSYAGHERNQRFLSIMESFLKDASDDRLTSLEDAVQSLKAVALAKESAKTGCIVRVE